jgi:hypothetical protein
MEEWLNIRDDVLECGRRCKLLPFFGSALSQYRPTNLPLGDGLRNVALTGAFPGRNLFNAHGQLLLEGKEIHQSTEVILQGLAEGLPDREQLTILYNLMSDLPSNPLHHILATAVQNHTVPALFTTNQDRCIEDIGKVLDPSQVIVPSYDEDEFGKGLRPSLFQFHGAIGGATPEEAKRRRQSLTFTLNSMGPFLSPNKHKVLADALASNTIIFLGYSGSDPDIWYSLDSLLSVKPTIRVYWCVRNEPRGHLSRLYSRYPNSIIMFRGDIVTVLEELSKVWNLPDFGHAELPTTTEKEAVLGKLQSWVLDLEPHERQLAYAWLLVSVGLHAQAALLLEDLIEAHKSHPIHMVASLYAGYARRELSDHHRARKHLMVALEESKIVEDVRYAQAAHKLGESLAAFESVRFWYFWPTIRRLNAGAAWLRESINRYEQIPPEKLMAKQLGRAGKANAKMNLGQLYRRAAAFVPGLRLGLAKRARQIIEEAREELTTREYDLRALPMAIAATAADDPRMSQSDKEKAIDKAIEYAEYWNQDEIQIGSAYFAKARLLATEDPRESELCYLKALAAFRQAGMRAEIARTELELALVLTYQANQTIHETEGSWEWKFGLRVLDVLKVGLTLFSIKAAANATKRLINRVRGIREVRP